MFIKPLFDVRTQLPPFWHTPLCQFIGARQLKEKVSVIISQKVSEILLSSTVTPALSSQRILNPGNFPSPYVIKSVILPCPGNWSIQSCNILKCAYNKPNHTLVTPTLFCPEDVQRHLSLDQGCNSFAIFIRFYFYLASTSDFQFLPVVIRFYQFFASLV